MCCFYEGIFFSGCGVVARLRSLFHSSGVADAVRTSLGPRGMDKMVCSSQVLVFAREISLLVSSKF
jgi:hypothetical protein